ncbi:MAG: hypothetical protein DRP47_03015, partial [Candidatus Zixiibacteriota bacterium]
MRRMFTILTVVGFVALIGALPALADWEPGDGHKMHYPQLPNETGWNVNATYPQTLADDWECSESGPVNEIHFWGSWLGGEVGILHGFNIAIYSDIPDPDGSGPEYSRPGAELWARFIPIEEIIIRQIIPDPQLWEGWYDPLTMTYNYPDHDNYWQYNIFNIPDPFYQTIGDTFWLVISAVVEEEVPEKLWGWKSSIDHWNDDAVWSESGPPFIWGELYEPPLFEVSMDLSFVINASEEDLGACCYPDGSCADLTQAVCIASSGIWQGLGTVCLGDNNSNGIDDACEGAADSDGDGIPDDGDGSGFPGDNPCVGGNT